MKIIISNDTGITTRNIPADIIQWMQTVPMDIPDGFEFEIDLDHHEGVKHAIRRFAELRLGRSVSFINHEGGGITCIRTGSVERCPTVMEEQIGPVAQDRINLIRVPGPALLQTTRNDAHEEPDNNDEDNYLTDESDSDENIGIVPPTPFNAIEADRASIALFIASSMEDTIASSAKTLDTKIMELGKLMSRVISLKREVNELTSMIGADPIIESLINEARILTEEDNLISRVYFTNSLLVIKTKRLRTDNVINGSIRDIGEMAITISLKSLVSKNATNEDPIKIFNLSQQYYDGIVNWQCGHVKHGSVCWGNAFEPLIEAIARRDIGLIAEIVIRFIKNPDPDDAWGKYIKHFPMARD